MKKKFAALLASFALVLALPALAFAANSPSGTGSVSGTDPASGNTVVVSSPTGEVVIGSEGTGHIHVEYTATTAKNTPTLSSNQVLAGNIHVWTDAGYEYLVSASNPLTIVFNAGTEYAGKAGTVYVEHESGATETLSKTVASDGTVSCTITELSYYTLVVDKSTTGTASSSTSSTSPKTGVDMAGVAVATAAMAAAAGCVFFALRRKND